MIEEDPQTFDRVLSSMCTEPHPAARAAAHRFLATNPGDPATYPAIADIERSVVEQLGEITGLPNPNGYVTSGGTEANIQAVRAARNRSSVEGPNIVVPANAHFSFRKAAEILDVEFRECRVDENKQADVAAMERAIDDRTILLVGVAGTTEYGRVDPIPEIAALAEDFELQCHVDAAWGGFVLPFTEYDWNFADAAIDTITIDPHKFGRASIPAGGFLCREEANMDALRVETPYLETGSQVALGGTRSGCGVASAKAVIDELWSEGYERQYRRCQSNADWATTELADRGLAVSEPTLPLLTATIADHTFDRLRDRGWRLSRTATGRLRLVCMPHVTRSMLESFFADFDAVRRR